jgi:hypothetical protein
MGFETPYPGIRIAKFSLSVVGVVQSVAHNDSLLAGRPGFDSWQGKAFYRCHYCVRSISEDHPSASQWILGPFQLDEVAGAYLSSHHLVPKVKNA